MTNHKAGGGESFRPPIANRFNRTGKKAILTINSMKLASIQTISEIRPIDGADRIEAATVLGYQSRCESNWWRPEPSTYESTVSILKGMVVFCPENNATLRHEHSPELVGACGCGLGGS